MLVIDRVAVAELARHHHVARLSMFGSGTTAAFDPERSDADFLVEFSSASPSPFDDYFGLKEELESLLERPVDLVTSQSLENPHFARSVARTSVEIYAA
ncbi:nucleotidyltransferase family protein [Brachybacterium sp.]|uniref:nucleotidyltransferase family protein n=1 Tax=Brachybacterium sp. TaxID=1891286 RepID=UPI002ED3820C